LPQALLLPSRPGLPSESRPAAPEASGATGGKTASYRRGRRRSSHGSAAIGSKGIVSEDLRASRSAHGSHRRPIRRCILR